MTGPLRDDRDMNNAVRSWLTESQEPTADRGRQIGRIMGRVDEVRQRRRMWPQNPFGRRAAGHEATGAEVTILPAHGRTAMLAPVRATAALAITVLVAVSIMWFASRPLGQQVAPGAWAVGPADQALFERFVTLWADEESDLAATQQVYAEDAVHRVLWLDEEEVISGDLSIGSRVQRTPSVGRVNSQPVRLPDHFSGAHRYLLLPTSDSVGSLANAACVLWVEDARIARDDCIMPMSIGSQGWPAMAAPGPSTGAEREELATAFGEALAAYDRAALEKVVSPEVAHHVLSTNQTYTLEGIDEYWSVMSLGGAEVMADVDLPAPAGEIRWANFSSVGTGTLCVFTARDGLITRHDCIVPSSTTVSASLTEIRTPPRD